MEKDLELEELKKLYQKYYGTDLPGSPMSQRPNDMFSLPGSPTSQRPNNLSSAPLPGSPTSQRPNDVSSTYMSLDEAEALQSQEDTSDYTSAPLTEETDPRSRTSLNSFFGPTSYDLESKLFLFGQGLREKRPVQTIAAGLSAGLQGARSVLGGYGVANRNEQIMNDYYEAQRQSTFTTPQYLEEGGYKKSSYKVKEYMEGGDTEDQALQRLFLDGGDTSDSFFDAMLPFASEDILYVDSDTDPEYLKRIKKNEAAENYNRMSPQGLFEDVEPDDYEFYNGGYYPVYKKGGPAFVKGTPDYKISLVQDRLKQLGFDTKVTGKLDQDTLDSLDEAFFKYGGYKKEDGGDVKNLDQNEIKQEIDILARKENLTDQESSRLAELQELLKNGFESGGKKLSKEAFEAKGKNIPGRYKYSYEEYLNMEEGGTTFYNRLEDLLDLGEDGLLTDSQDEELQSMMNYIEDEEDYFKEGGLKRWFSERWVDIKTGKPCGRKEGEKRGYPACRPSKRVNKDTPKTAGEMSKSEKDKFKREKTSGKRIDYNHKKEEGGYVKYYKNGGTAKPKNKELYARVKAEAKKKFDRWPSAYSSAWLVREYKKRGGTYEYGGEVQMQGGGRLDLENLDSIEEQKVMDALTSMISNQDMSDDDLSYVENLMMYIENKDEQEDIDEGLVEFKQGGVMYRGERFPGYNKPKRAPKGSKKKYRVLARQNGKTRIVEFGARGYQDFLQHKDSKRRKNFKSRHNCKSKNNKLKAGWWACNYNW